MKKIYRLSDWKVFTTITKRKKIYSKKYLIHYQKNNKGFFRIAINIPKSKFKLAVQRNKIKRQMRTIFDQIKDKDYSIDLLVIVNVNYLKDTYVNNCKDFLDLIEKIKHK